MKYYLYQYTSSLHPGFDMPAVKTVKTKVTRDIVFTATQRNINWAVEITQEAYEKELGYKLQ